MFLRLLGDVDLAGDMGIGNGESHAARPQRIPGDGAGEFARLDGRNGRIDAVDADDRNLAGKAVLAQRLEGAHAHAVIGGEHALDLVAEAGEPGLGDLEGLLLVPVGGLEVEQRHLAVGLGDGVVEADLALDGGHVGENAAQRHDAAFAAEGLEQLIGDGLAVGTPSKDMWAT